MKIKLIRLQETEKVSKNNEINSLKIFFFKKPDKTVVDML